MIFCCPRNVSGLFAIHFFICYPLLFSFKLSPVNCALPPIILTFPLSSKIFNSSNGFRFNFWSFYSTPNTRAYSGAKLSSIILNELSLTQTSHTIWGVEPWQINTLDHKKHKSAFRGITELSKTITQKEDLYYVQYITGKL